MMHLYYRLRRKIAFLKGEGAWVSRWSAKIMNHKVLSIFKNEFRDNVPPMVHVEITTDCNYKCPFCAQAKHKRESKYITNRDYDLLIEKLRTVGFSSSLVLYVDCEPFMHPELMSFCEKASRLLPKADVGLQSNGDLIQKSHMDYLASLERPPLLLIDDYTPGQTITEKIKPWLEFYKGRPFEKRVMFFKRSWNEKLSNFAGNARGCNSNISDYNDIICTWPFNSMFLDADLNAFLCCFDYNHEVVLGSLKKQSLMEIWTSEPYKMLRASMLESQRKNLRLCKKCDVEWYNLPTHCSK